MVTSHEMCLSFPSEIIRFAVLFASTSFSGLSRNIFLWWDSLAWFFLAVLTSPILTASVLNFSNYVWWFGGPSRHPSSKPVTNFLLRKRSCRCIMLELTFNPYKALEWGLERWLSACLASMRTCVEFDLRNLYEKLDVVACACFSCAG